ncbi:hypothetical protein EVAR_66708_1 [Eumeta japonica]|uniref:Uncharacterized protein n=1 Tax=Eumeta variegata TaxID=151549 RepID=A0A4C1ZQ13_EUMVA|nr:hypothetical protein EVAR_66708_1 [Eumeta japonica]
MEMRLLHSMCGVSRKDRCRNSDVRERRALKEDVVTRVERGMLRWFGHQVRMNESRLTKQICRTNVYGVVESSSRVALENPVQTILKGSNFQHPKPTSLLKRLMDVGEARKICKDYTM